MSDDRRVILAMSDRKPEFPFQHPAAEEVSQIFRTFGVRSEEDYRDLSPRDRYVWDVFWFETEVMNGGVDQYFYNSAGDHAAECLQALQAIGAKQSYSLLKQACDLFPEGQPSANFDVRREQLRKLPGRDLLAKRKHLDDLIGEIEVNLYQLLLNFYRKADPNSK